MDAASLRIKFTPLLKKISSENMKSKCCIEIVPELSRIQNLDKLNWRATDDLIQCRIPMMYKIIIKKQKDNFTEDIRCKTYHSCVDLLNTYSQSNLGSGDVKRVASDHSHLMHLGRLSEEKCEVIPTKDLLARIKACDLTQQKKIVSTQTLETWDLHNPACHCLRPTVDKCSEVNMNKLESITNFQASKSQETLKGNSNSTADVHNKNDIKTDSNIFLETYLKTYNNKMTKYQPTLMSPLNPINTCNLLNDPNVLRDQIPNAIPGSKANKSARVCSEIKDQNREKNQNISSIYDARTNLTIKKINKCSNTENGNIRKNYQFFYSEPPRYISVTNITTSLSQILISYHDNTDLLINKLKNKSFKHSGIDKSGNRKVDQFVIGESNITKNDQYNDEYNIDRSKITKTERYNIDELKLIIDKSKIRKADQYSTTDELKISRADQHSMDDTEISNADQYTLDMPNISRADLYDVDELKTSNTDQYRIDELKISKADLYSFDKLNISRADLYGIKKSIKPKLGQSTKEDFLPHGYNKSKSYALRQLDFVFTSKRNNIAQPTCKIDYNSNIRLTPAARVAQFIKTIEEEISPLQQKLNEIKCRCVVLGLGLFCGEFIPYSHISHKSILRKPVYYAPSFDYQIEESNKDEDNLTQSNRVVHTVLFNG